MARILIVDDEVTIHGVISAVIDDRAPILSAETLAEGRRLMAEAGPVDVAVVDKNLPDGSGIALIEQIRRLYPQTECILITGYASLESAVEAIEVGAFDYVTKPFDVGSIELRIARALEKVRLTREHAESEARYRMIFESSPDAILVVDPGTGSIVDANAAAQTLYGYGIGELRGMPIEHLTESSAGEGRAGPRLPGAEPPSIDPTPSHRRRDGTRVPVEVYMRPLTLDGRELCLQTVRDISDRNELEGQLRQSQKMNAIGRLAGGIAHDFNNLLVIMLGYADLLSRHLDAGDPNRQHAVEILRAAERASALTRQLLTFSRKKPAAVRTLLVNDAVREVEGLLVRTLGEEIRLRTQLEAALWAVHADEDHISQILLNLAVNARDAMPGGGTLTIATRNVDPKRPADRRTLRQAGLPPGRWISLSVTDTGCGMSPEVANNAFEPFFTTKAPGAGTGLGLAVVYGLVQQSGGAIKLDTAPGRGTTFSVFMPAAQTTARVEAAPRGPKVAAPVGETVLLVEDEPAVRALVRRMLASAGYAVLEAERGDEALRILREDGQRIDLLVTDVRMPGMSGLALAGELEKTHPRLPVLYISGYPQNLDLSPSTRGPRVSFLAKPFTEEVLLGQLRRVLDDEPTAP